jgi:hypothetical protein
MEAPTTLGHGHSAETAGDRDCDRLGHSYDEAEEQCEPIRRGAGGGKESAARMADVG